MRLILAVLIVGVASASVVGWAPASADVSKETVVAHVQRKLSIRESVRVSFTPNSAYPSLGYYYAVVVLKPYRHYTRKKPPPCSASSDMQSTRYGYAHDNAR
jgi:hypothetical protein